MPSKLLILHGEAKYEFFTIVRAPESMFIIIFSTFTVISFVSACSEENITAKLSHVNKNKGVAD